MVRIAKPFVVGIILSLVVAAGLPSALGSGTAGSGSRAGTVRLVVKVSYRTGSGVQPLADVPVHALIQGVRYEQCSDPDGKVAFKNLPAGATVEAVGTGPSTTDPGCRNPRFKNPDTGRKMLAVAYDDHHGVAVFDAFDLPATGGRVVKFVARTPRNQNRICMGLKATPGHVGTGAPETIVGTDGPDVIHGRGGADLIRGLGGDDWVCGGAGPDELLGDGGDDVLFGEAGRDVLDGGSGGDFLFGGKAADSCLRGEILDGCEA